MTKNEEKAIEILKNTRQAWCRILSRYIDNKQKEIEQLKFENHMVKKWNEQLDKNCISKDKIREKLNKYREKLEKLHSQELWNEPEDSIKDFKYNYYLEAYKQLLEKNTNE